MTHEEPANPAADRNFLIPFIGTLAFARKESALCLEH